MNKVHTIFLDLDNTLVQSESNVIDKETIKVLRFIVKQGIEIVINTRRNFSGCKELMKKLYFIKYWIISSSGFIYFNHIDRLLMLREIPKEIVNRELESFNYCQIEFSDGRGLACMLNLDKIDNQLLDLIYRVNQNNRYEVINDVNQFREIVKNKTVVNLYKDGVNVYNNSKLFGAQKIISIASLYLNSGEIVVLDDSDSDLSLAYKTYAPKENTITDKNVITTNYSQKDFVKKILKELL